MAYMNGTAIEEAAKVIASGRGEGTLARAANALAAMKHAVQTILGGEVEVLKRTSKSTGTERLAFLIDKVEAGAKRKMSNLSMSEAERFTRDASVMLKAGQVSDHLTARGVDASHVLLDCSEPGYNNYAVDVVLNDKVLQYVPGQQAERAINKSDTVRGL